jgi:hypothetical protein
MFADLQKSCPNKAGPNCAPKMEMKIFSFSISAKIVNSQVLFPNFQFYFVEQKREDPSTFL